MRHVSTGDAATDHNLMRLDHLASADRFDSDVEAMQTWLVAVIQSIEMLPKAAKRHFGGDYYLGDMHYHMTPERRIKECKDLVSTLRAQVDAAFADKSLQADENGRFPDLSDRRQTKGERILALCARLLEEHYGTPELSGLLAQLQSESMAGIGSDVAELKRLSARKRIPDVAEHSYWIRRHIEHIRSIAQQLHHLD